ncbi:DUF5107 domain-containing protein [Niallia sp. JL1B1071]|uniref:DUF5107 domain-containing protein n=1 Tax=Niallia tiangongensis TaxID=3237105 RepID=UPI0037DCD60B
MSSRIVKMWEEKVIIPTYKTAKADKNPLFFEKRVYQGSSGKVYPLPITEKIADEKENVEYNAVFLENDYLKIMLLPELGGRIHRAYDKTNDYDFVYYNHVIKPALVGLVGPWISGGIEFNWPQHHRPSTYMPTEYTLVENKDGSKTVYISEIDQMYGTKGMAGFTLYPNKAYIEISGKLYNRTDIPQTFLWWANPAVPVNDHTFSVFPPDVHAVMDHGKRAVSSFPIATGTYYKYDYSEGIDISRYKNIEVPTSYMAHHSDFNFIGNYDEQKQAGLLHVADHHVSPGKKQWTWGNSDFGQAWDRNLTDEDGPYIELMTGVFTDNQPDFTWLKPYEEKTFTQYFMPYKGIGRVKNATKRAAINIEKKGDKIEIACYSTEEMNAATVHLLVDDEIVFTDSIQLAPNNYYKKLLDLHIPAINERVKLALFDEEGQEIVVFQGLTESIHELPEPAEELPSPKELKSTEDLFLAATHIEQYRHATLNAEDYYVEGLRRDESDIRLNNGYGMYLYRQGRFNDSEKRFRKAVEKQTWKSPNPYYGEPLFNLGLSLLMQGEVNKSYEAFYKSTWNDDTQGASFFQLACIETSRGNLKQATSFIDKALTRNMHNMKARHLEIVLIRKKGENTQQLLEVGLNIDRMDLGLLYEKSLATNNYAEWLKAMRASINNYLEIVGDYIRIGCYHEALNILKHCPKESPLLHYYSAYIYLLLEKKKEAKEEVIRGENSNSDYCFPSKLIEKIILERIIEVFPEESSFACYYLGNLMYDKKCYTEAMQLWERSLEKRDDFAILYRNLSFAYFNQNEQSELALPMMEKAFQIDSSDARLLLELDLLKAKKGFSVEERLSVLEENIDTTSVRDDLFVEYIKLLNNIGKYDEALNCIMNRQFHPWEGGEGKVSTQYVYSLIQLARRCMIDNSKEALAYVNRSLERPYNLGEGKLPNYHDNISQYYLGQIYESKGQLEQANIHYRRATKGTTQPESIMYYNDQPPEAILYKGFAHEKLGEVPQAKKCFHQLLSYGQTHYYDEVEYDYFAVSLPATVVFKENLSAKNRVYCNYLLGLGYLGLEEYEASRDMFNKVLQVVPDYQGAIQHLELIKEKTQKTELSK